MKKVPTIVLTGGGSGGHITPLLPLAHALKKTSKECRVVFIGLKDEVLQADLKKRYSVFDEVHSVPSGKFRRYHGESLLAHLTDVHTIGLNIRDFFRVLSGIGHARKLLKKINPDVVFSKGGFVAVPVGIAANLLRIPTVTHDSDAIPGLANRIVGRFANIHATGMPAKYYAYPKESTYYVGIPIDERIKTVSPSLQADFKRQLGLPPSSLVLLVGGAGLGARDVNNKVLAVATKLLDAIPSLHILHIAGGQHRNQVEADYGAAAGKSGRVKVVDFTPDFYKYSGAADLVVTRAGATTIAELAVQKKAVILIPAPHLSGGHQLKNAEELARNHAVLVVPNEAAPEELYKKIVLLLEDGSARKELADKLGELAKADAADTLAGLLLETAGKQKKLEDAQS